MIKEFSVGNILLDWTLYPRTEVSDETVLRLKEAILSGAKIPPIIIDKKTKKLVDGFHRHKAYQELKLNKILVEEKEYRNEKEIIEDMGQMNSSHGRPFSSQDCRRFIILASSVGLTKEKIAGILNVTREKLETWTLQRAVYGAEEIPLKRGLSHLVGRKLTNGQNRLNKEWGGMNATFYVNQLILYIQAEAVEADNFNFIERMDLLAKIWEKARKKLL